MDNKNKIFRGLILVTSFFAVSCSCKNNKETKDNVSNTNNSTSSNTNNGSNSSETMLVSSLPNSFTFQEKEYFIDRENKDTSLVTFLGYLINYNDLDKWKDYDNNLIYCTLLIMVTVCYVLITKTNFLIDLKFFITEKILKNLQLRIFRMIL